MKTIVIGGVCRTGKSTLASKIFHNTKATVFHGDHLMNILYNNFPESVQDEYPKVLITKILIKLIRNMGKEFNYTRIFESSHIDPIIAKHKLNHPDYIFLFLGYPKVNIYKKLRELREYAAKHPHCWTHEYSDQSLILQIKNFIEISQQHQKKCDIAGIAYFDTSENFLEAWERAYGYVMKNLVD